LAKLFLFDMPTDKLRIPCSPGYCQILRSPEEITTKIFPALPNILDTGGSMLNGSIHPTIYTQLRMRETGLKKGPHIRFCQTSCRKGTLNRALTGIYKASNKRTLPVLVIRWSRTGSASYTMRARSPALHLLLRNVPGIKKSRAIF